jgi:hypothetical protein
MSIVMTPHGNRSRDTAGAFVDVLPGQTGNRVAVAIGGSANGLTAGLYRIKAVAACRVRIGAAGDDAAQGEPWSAGDTEVRFVGEGQSVKVAAA